MSPTLVMHVELDPLPEAFSALIAQGIAGSDFVVLKGINHFAYVENPGPLFGVVRPFLRRRAK